MMDREAMLAKLIQSRQVMRTTLSRLDPQRVIYPEWTVKELLAHLAGWDDACNASMRAHLRGQEPETPAERGINYYNSQSVLERVELTLAQITREYDQSREEFIQLIREMPQEKLEEPFILPWADRGTVQDLVHIFSEHEEEHAREIQALLQA